MERAERGRGTWGGVWTRIPPKGDAPKGDSARRAGPSLEGTRRDKDRGESRDATGAIRNQRERRRAGPASRRETRTLSPGEGKPPSRLEGAGESPEEQEGGGARRTGQGPAARPQEPPHGSRGWGSLRAPPHVRVRGDRGTPRPSPSPADSNKGAPARGRVRAARRAGRVGRTRAQPWSARPGGAARVRPGYLGLLEFQ